MKKLIVVLMIALLPTLAFALDFQLGGTAMYKGMLEDLEDGGASELTFDDFTFGGEARLSWTLLQGSVAALYYPNGAGASLVAMTDVGVTLNLAIVRLGAGIGPNFYIPLNDGDVAKAGLNLKGAVDLQLGGLSIGLVGYYYLASFEDLNADLFEYAQPWLGVTVLFKLF